MLPKSYLAAALALGAFATPAHAVTMVSACDPTLPSPDAFACAGNFDGDLFPTLPAGAVKVEALTDLNKIDFGQMLYGLTIVGAHFTGMVDEVMDTSVFWLFDFGSDGVVNIMLDDTQGFADATLFTTGSAPSSGGGVPEPASWMTFLLGFMALGYAMRRRSVPKVDYSYA